MLYLDLFITAKMALEEKGLTQGSTDAQSNATVETRKRKKHVV